MTNEAPQKLAAPAPQDDETEDLAVESAELAERAELHELCLDWSWWCRTRRFYVRPSLPASLLGKLRTPTATRRGNGGPDAIASAELAAFHLAVLGQPSEALDRKVFELHYYWGVRNVKASAATLGISRQHWYRLVNDFRERAYRASREILAANIHSASCLSSQQSQQ